jgi:DNA-binding transcriptional LysR family regulator
MDTDNVHTEVRQSQNPSSSTTQKYSRTTETPTGVRTTESNEVVIGAAQKDTAREMAAKLGSLHGVVWVGVLLFVFGIASAFYPPLKLIVGSVTTSAACAAAGVALIILPSLLVGHELLILAVGGGAVGIWFFAHRHGGLRATVELLKSKV